MNDLSDARSIFSHALKLSEVERLAFVDGACSGRPSLRDQVERMLSAFETASAVGAPVVVRASERQSRAPQTRFTGTDRFVVQRQLGSGAFGTVYQVWDREQQVTVAAKVLHSSDAETLLRFKHEFRFVVSLRHRNLVRLLELFSKQDQWFFTMELIDGEDFLEHVRPGGGRPRIDRLRAALPQLVAAVRALHASDKLHRDLKPGNVMVERGGRVVLLDFGMVRDIDAGDGQVMTLVGTPAYMAPELLREPPTEASDWYSVGVMLFQALTGKLPPAAILRLADGPWVGIDEVFGGERSDLQDLCRRLLELRPEDRPRAAEIAAIVGSSGHPDPRASGELAADAPPEIFVGRAAQLDALATAFGETRLQAGIRVVLFEGPSGMGKTATVRKFLRAAAVRSPNLIVLHGRCYEFESVPYKGLDALVDELTNILRELPESEVHSLLPREAFLLPRLFPIFERVKAIAQAPVCAAVPDEQELRHRTFRVFREMLARLGDRRPLIVWIDDLQWSDRDSITFLADLCAPPEQPPLFLVLAYRNENLDSNPNLRYLRQVLTSQRVLGNVRQIGLPALTAEESREFVEALLPGVGDCGEMREKILDEAAGHPLFLQELAHEAARGKARGVRQQTELRGFLQRRIERLPRPARDALEYTCLAGEPLSPDLLLSLTFADGAADSGKAEILPLLVSEHLVRFSGTGDTRQVEPFHDQVRNAVTAMAPPETRKLRHSRLASMLSGGLSVEPQVLVAHFLEAGNIAAAHAAAKSAAEAAERQLAFDRAAELYETALRTCGENLSLRVELHRRRADMLGKAGRGYDASHAYLAAADAGAADPFELRRLAADQLMRSGHIDEALGIIEQLSKRHRVRMVRTPAQAVAGIAVGRIKTRLLLAAGIPKPKRGCPDRAALDRLELMRTAGIVLNIADPVQATYFQVQYILNALKVADPGHLVSALAIEASIRVTGGRRHTDEAERFLRAARELAGDNPNALGFVQLCSEYVGYLLGDIRRCAADGERAVNFLREKCTGVAWEITAGHVMLFWALCWSGEVERVRELLPQLLKEGAARGDINVEVSLRLLSYIHYAYLSADQPEACLQESQQGLERWSKKGYHLQHYGALFTRVETYLYMGDYRRAREELLSHWQTMSRSLILRWQILRVMAWFLRGRTALACWLDDRPDRSLYREVENCCRSLRRIDSPWSSAIVAALTGGIAVGEGRRDDAVRQLIRAAVEFQQISLNGYAASARYLAGALMANDEGRRLTEEATAFFQSQHVQNHSSFRRMLLPGNWIADTGVK